MMNGPLVNKQAALLAERVRKEVGGETTRLYPARSCRWSCSARRPSSEIAEGVGLMARLQKRGAKPEQAQTYLCLMALNLNEFRLSGLSYPDITPRLYACGTVRDEMRDRTRAPNDSPSVVGKA